MDGSRRSSTPEEAARLRREASALAAAAHPGVAEVLGVEDDGHTVVLRTTAEGRPLADVGDLGPDEVAGIVAALAATVADLHRRGLGCGDLDADDVRLAPDGRPLLLSVGVEALDPAEDVAAIGRLASRLLDGASAGQERLAAALAELAAAACHPDRGQRPSAAALAAAIARRVPTARLPRPVPDRAVLGQVRSAAARRRRLVLPGAARRMAVAAGIVAALTAPFLVRSGPASRPGEARARTRPPPPTTAVAGPTTATRPPAASVVASAVASATCPPPPPPAFDPDGDGCQESLRFDAGILVVGGTRYQVGRPGDHLVTGDWDCDRRDMVALWRPATGEVFAFAGWAGPGEDLPAERMATVPDATGAEVADVDGDGCDEIVLARPGREAAVVRPDPPRSGVGPPRWPAAGPPP